MRSLGDDPGSDAELAREAGAGKAAAFEALYRRHASAAWRLASAVAANSEDAADAVSEGFTRVLTALEAGRLVDGNLFRSYLLTATRNAAVDLHRRADRARPPDRLEELQLPAVGRSSALRADAPHDAGVVESAFRGLPERWRTVLWLTEVEGKPAREVASLLGLTANTAAQLALRARSALRQRFVQAHLRLPVAENCRFCVDRLGGYVTDRLSPRELAKVDLHLSGCVDCRQRATDLDDLGSSLRRVVPPLPLLLGPAAIEKWKLTWGVIGAASAPAPVGATAVATAWTDRNLPRLQRPLAVASTGIFALAVISSSVINGAIDELGTTSRRSPLAELAPTPPQIVEDVALAVDLGLGVLDAVTDALTRFPGGGGTGDAVARGGAGSGGSGRLGGPGANAAPAPRPEPLLRAGTTVVAAGQPVGVTTALGDGACTGVVIISARTGCAPPVAPRGMAGATVETDGTAVGELLNDRSVSISV